MYYMIRSRNVIFSRRRCPCQWPKPEEYTHMEIDDSHDEPMEVDDIHDEPMEVDDSHDEPMDIDNSENQSMNMKAIKTNDESRETYDSKGESIVTDSSLTIDDSENQSITDVKVDKFDMTYGSFLNKLNKKKYIN